MTETLEDILFSFRQVIRDHFNDKNQRPFIDVSDVHKILDSDDKTIMKLSNNMFITKIWDYLDVYLRTFNKFNLNTTDQHEIHAMVNFIRHISSLEVKLLYKMNTKKGIDHLKLERRLKDYLCDSFTTIKIKDDRIIVCTTIEAILAKLDGLERIKIAYGDLHFIEICSVDKSWVLVQLLKYGEFGIFNDVLERYRCFHNTKRFEKNLKSFGIRDHILLDLLPQENVVKEGYVNAYLEFLSLWI